MTRSSVLNQSYAFRTDKRSQHLPKDDKRLLAELKWISFILYLDDIVVFLDYILEHFARLGGSLKRLKKSNLKIKII